MRFDFVRLVLLSWMFLIGLYACGDNSHERTSRDYNDPESTYTPPDYRAPGGKSDLYSPNPFIRKVEWLPEGRCDTSQISPMVLKFNVEDHDTKVDDLIFEGSVSGCNPIGRGFSEMINANEVVVMCHHVSRHDGMVVVRDPDGHVDSVLFSFGPCAQGTAEYGK